MFNSTKTFSSTFKVLADSITSMVKGEETYTDPVTGETKTNTFGTLLKQTANNVLIKATKNASTDAAGGQALIESLINVAPEGIKIAANHIDVEGAAIFKSGGKLAKVVKSSQTQWYSSTSASERKGGSWSTNQPAVTAGRFIWQRTYYQYTDGTSAYDPNEAGVCVTALTDISATIKAVDVEYAQGTSPTTAPDSGWSTTAPTIAAGKYLWTRTKTTFANNQSSYTKTTCISGDNGKLVTAAKEQYYLSSSSTAQTGGSWVDTCPTWATGKYIWTRTHMTYSDGTTGASTPTLATAINDANSKAYQTVTGIDVEYADSTSSTTAPTTGWSTTAPAWQAGHYIWQRTKTMTPVGTSYSKATCISGRDGVDGAKGDKGDKGNDGVGITSIVEQYYQSSSASSQTGGSWVTTPPAYAKGKYYWTRSKITWTNSTVTYTDPVLANDVTSIAEIANASTKTAVQLWFTKANTTAPDKPKSKVTSTSTAPNEWRVVVPIFNASYPNYFYCWQYTQMDGTCAWSDVVYDAQATESLGTARGAQARSQLIFKNFPAGTLSVSGTTTWVTETGQVNNAWTTKFLEHNPDRPVIFCATQSQTVAQMAAGSTCSCTTPVKDDTLTKIDGGHITTGEIDASVVTVKNIDASKITVGELDAARIKANSLAIGKFTTDVQNKINKAGSDTTYRGVCSSGLGDATKVVACTGFELCVGASIVVYMSTEQMCVDTLYLNVNNTGAKTIYVGDKATSGSNQLLWAAGASITFTYDGSHWVVADSPGTWNGGVCTSTASESSKYIEASLLGKIVVFEGVSVKVQMQYENTSSNARLYILSLAMSHYINFGSLDVAPTVDNGYSWRARTIVEFVFDGRCWRTGSRTYIDGGSIVTGKIDTNRLDATSIQANIVKTCELNANKIKTGTLSGSLIRGGTIEGCKFKSYYNGNDTSRYLEIDDSRLNFYGVKGCMSLCGNVGDNDGTNNPSIRCELKDLNDRIIEMITFTRHHLDLRLSGTTATTQYNTCGIDIYRDDGDASYSGQVRIYAPKGLYINGQKYA